MNGSETLDRIQQEIKQDLQREEELKKEYAKINNNNETITTNGEVILLRQQLSRQETLNGGTPNGYTPNNDTPNGGTPNGGTPNGGTPIGGTPNSGTPNSIVNRKIPPTPPSQAGRRFAPNPLAKGVMHKFFKMRGKVNVVNSMKSSGTVPKTWSLPDFEPAKVTMESGKPLRNGFVSAEEKMRRELEEFQQREAELRKERRKSQPDLMAVIEAEEIPMKPARSMAQLYSLSGEDSSETSSGPPSLKPAKSLAELCDIDDDLRGTHSLIRQFENLKDQGRI